MSSKFEASSGAEITPEGLIKHMVQEATNVELRPNTLRQYHIHTNHVMIDRTVDIINKIEGVNNCVLMGKYIIMVHVGCLFDEKSVLEKACRELDLLGKNGYQKMIDEEYEGLKRTWTQYGQPAHSGTLVTARPPQSNNYAIFTDNGQRIMENPNE